MFKWIEKIIDKVVGTDDEPVKYLKGVDTKNLEKKTKTTRRVQWTKQP